MKTLIVNGPKTGQWVDFGTLIENGQTFCLPKIAAATWNLEEEILEPMYHEYLVFRETSSFFGTTVVLQFAIDKSVPHDQWGSNIAKSLYHRDVIKEGMQL